MVTHLIKRLCVINLNDIFYTNVFFFWFVLQKIILKFFKKKTFLRTIFNLTVIYFLQYRYHLSFRLNNIELYLFNSNYCRIRIYL